MNTLLISTGAAFSAIALLAVGPVQAGTLTFGYEVDSELQVTFGSLLTGNTFSGVTVPSSLQVTADDVTGSFTVLDDPAQFTDGSIVLDDGLLNDALLSSSYEAMVDAILGDYDLTTSEVIESVDNLFVIDDFQGGGELVSKDFTLPLSPFTISYDGDTNTVVVDGYDTQVAESCLSTTCLLDGSVSYDVSLVISEFITVTNELLTNSSISLDSETTAAIANLQQMAQLANLLGIETFELASVSVTSFDAITDPIGAAPDSSDLDATVTDGLIEVRINDQEDPIFSESLGSDELAAEPPAPVVEVPTVTDPEPPVSVVEVPTIPVAPEPATVPLLKPLTVDEDNNFVIADDLPLTVATALPETSGGSISITTTSVLALESTAEDSSDAQAVPEPSIMAGLLGITALVKRSRKQTVN